jgi:hypothetical protein
MVGGGGGGLFRVTSDSIQTSPTTQTTSISTEIWLRHSSFHLRSKPWRFYKRRADVVFAIYIADVYIHGAFSVISGASSVESTGREKGSEEGRVRGNEWGVESQCS